MVPNLLTVPENRGCRVRFKYEFPAATRLEFADKSCCRDRNFSFSQKSGDVAPHKIVLRFYSDSVGIYLHQPLPKRFCQSLEEYGGIIRIFLKNAQKPVTLKF